MLKTASTDSSLDPIPPQPGEKPAKPSSPRDAMRFPGDQPKAPPSPPPRQTNAGRSGCQESSGPQG